MAINCPSCQHTLNDSARFCTRCGGAITSADSGGMGKVSNPTAETVVSTDSLVGRVLDGRYHILMLLGAGGMGTVYRARRVHIGDDVAVKVLHPQFVADDTMVERFRREARAAAMLHHANIVAIYDFGETDSGDAPAYIVMELVAGESLREILRREGELELMRALVLMRDICAGIGAAHRRNIVHRDLKPDNIIVIPAQADDERETVKVVDFGIARLRDLAASKILTQTGVLIGTPYYMSPEQCLGEHAESPADVYSLGAILYEMLAGVPPFTAQTATGVITKHITEAPQPLPARRGVNPAVEAVIMRALAKKPESRQPDATTLARELLAANAVQASVPADLPATAPVEIPPRRREQSTTVPQPAADQVVATDPAHQWQRTSRQASPQTLSEPSSSRAPLVIGLAAGVIVLSVGLAIGAWMMRGGDDRGVIGSEVSSANTQAEIQRTPAPAKELGSNAAMTTGNNLSVTDSATTKLVPSASAPATSPLNTSQPQNTQGSVSPGPPGKYLVILGSFRKADQRAKAEGRLGFLRGRGYDVHIIDSDNYPKLTRGLWVVSMGPYAKPYATRLASELRVFAPEGAYVKAGH